MMQFKAFKPEGLNKIAGAMGYKGDMSKFQDFIEQDPARMARMNMFTQAAQQMARGGMVNMQTGGIVQGKVPKFNTTATTFGGTGATGTLGTAVDAFNASNQQQATSFTNALQQQVGGNITPGGGSGGQSGIVPSGPLPNEIVSTFPQFTPFGGNRFPQNEIVASADYVFRDSQGNRIDDPLKADPRMSGPSTIVNLSTGQPETTTTSTKTASTTPSYTAPTQATTPTTPTFVSNPVTKSTPVTKPVLDEDGNPVLDADGNPTTEPVLDADGNPVMQTSLQIGDVTTNRVFDPRLAEGAVTQAQTTTVGAEQFIPEGTGALSGDKVAVSTAQAAIAQADAVTEKTANTMQAAQSAPGVNTALDTVRAAQTNPDDPRAKITAAQQTASSVGNLDAAQGNAILMDSPVQRQIQNGELISGVANAQTAAQFTEQIQAAEATPSQQATVQGQLANLTQNFDAANPPAWAAGALRNANAQMAARGLGASSLAGQAIIQATLEAALPIAQADAKTTAAFESQNLSNRQQRAMLSAEQRAKFIGQEFDQAFQARVQNASRIADIANQNFTAEQQVALENSRIANTMNLNNLSNRQALVIAEASALANMDLSNLSNRQQASVQNAQNFLSMDMANLSNRQQTDLFKAQQRVQSMFTDTAATNAARQFNASSQSQTDQFFANLASAVSQFNASQSNAQGQFNAGQLNTIERFNAELNNQRDQFEAQNQLVIAQSNAQWRREYATADTAAINRVNELNASAVLDISKQAYDNLWNYYADTMEWAWTSAESQLDRINALAIAELDSKTRTSIAGEQAGSAAGTAVGNLISTLGSAYIMSGFCWVAREVYGPQNLQWFIFRAWLQFESPKWFKNFYGKHGKTYAKVIKYLPPLKWVTKKFMDYVVDKKKRKHNVSCVI
jgi:hypothetical protein